MIELLNYINSQINPAIIFEGLATLVFVLFVVAIFRSDLVSPFRKKNFDITTSNKDGNPIRDKNKESDLKKRVKETHKKREKKSVKLKHFEP